jgi:hypothetical protein
MKQGLAIAKMFQIEIKYNSSFFSFPKVNSLTNEKLQILSFPSLYSWLGVSQ